MRPALSRSVMFLALATGAAHAQPEPAPGSDPVPVPEPVPAEPTTPAAPEPTPKPVPAPEPPAIEPSRTPPSVVPPEPPKPEPGLPSADRGFRFGSYGRLVAGTDLRGGKPEAANVVAFGPRVVEPSYLELDLSYGFTTPSGHRLRPVITLAFDGTLFHETGDFDAQPALRNVFLDAEITPELTAWVGSRMYRGDDIYLFSYWPLDDQNTVGGGLVYRRFAERDATGQPRGDMLELAGHAGFNRLNRDFQFQEVSVPDPEQGATTVTQLNRQRIVASATATYILAGLNAGQSFKIKAHGEVHALGAGTRERTDGTLESLPADSGILGGFQVGTFGERTEGEGPSRLTYRRHAHFFLRYATGLAAYDELAPPTTFGADLTTSDANELSFGTSANFDHELGNILVGALSRRFIDADVSTSDRDDGWEYAVSVRPLVRTARSFFVGGDFSYQARFPRGLNPNTQLAQDPAVLQIAPMLVYSPMGPSAYDRPQLRLVYRAARYNEAALDQFVPDDPRREHTWTHFLGVQAEWWFNSSTYR